MIEFNDIVLADNGQEAADITLIDNAGFDAWFNDQGEAIRNAVKAQKFKGKADSHAILPSDNEAGFSVVAGVKKTAALGHWCLAAVSEKLPAGHYRIDSENIGGASLGWMMAHYRFDEYLSDKNAEGPRVLLVKSPANIGNAAREAQGMALVRDLVNRPAADVGPSALEAEAKRMADANGGTLTVTKGDALEQGYPMIHAVGRAAGREHAPRLIELEWGDERHPRICLIGKGVCFDSGGLDIKPASGMRLMKKDMGGAAHVLALSEMIMQAQLPIRLHTLVSAVENAISGNAFRPGDILKSRKGLTVEVDNTDAEGRLVLADALTKAQEDSPEIMIDFATLTGAARVALGPDLPPLFSNDDALGNGIVESGMAKEDPLWRMPLWDAYNDMLKSDIADIVNSGGGFAGAVTAALFLQRFVDPKTSWVHIDTFAWMPTSKAGRPKGGEALGLRAVFGYLAERFPAK